MKKCDKCGFENDDSMNYCGKCGVEIAEIKEKTIVDSSEKEKKSEQQNNKKTYKIKQWVGCFIILVIIACGAMLILKNDVKQIITYYNSGDVKSGEALYEKLNEKELEKVNHYFEEQIELTKTSFVNKEIDQKDAKEKLMKIKKMSSLDESVDTVIKEIEELNQSRVAFNKGKSYRDKQQYVEAYSNFAKVSEIDTENYTTAQTEMTKVKENAIEKALADAETFYKEKNYDQAVSRIESVLAIGEGDERLENIKAIYENEKEQAMQLVVGKDLSTETKQIKYLGCDFTTRILPPNTSNWYLYYAADDDKIFLDMKFKVKNLDKYEMHLNNIFTDVKLDYNNGYSYNTVRYYWTQGDNINIVYNGDKLEPLNETTYHVVVEVPRTVAKDDKPITVTLNAEHQAQILIVR